MKRTIEPSESNISSTNLSSKKLLLIIEYLSDQAEPVRLLDIAKGTKINASTASRFLTALMSSGYVQQDQDSGRYTLTYKICRLAYKVNSRIDIRQISLPFLQELSRKLNCTCNLVVEYDQSVMYLEVVTPQRQILTPLQYIGGVAPMHCTGAGKVLLTQYTDDQLVKLESARGFKEYTTHTIRSLSDLKQDLNQIKQRGFAYDNEECELGTRCVAAPIYNYSGNIVAAISINGPIGKFTDEYLSENIRFVTGAASQISAQLGYDM